MKPFRRIAVIVLTALALGLSSTLPSAAQSDVNALNKQIVELSQAKKFAEAVPLAQRVLEIRERTLPRDHPDIAAARKTLAQLYRALGRNAEAEALEKQAQASRSFELAAAPTAAPKVAAAPPPPAPPQVAAASPPPPRDAPLVTRGAPSRSMGSPPSGAPSKTLPDFPWPPPAASATYVLPKNVFANRATVGQVADSILAALERTGYVERSFFRTQAEGVALVTRLERINDDGTARAESDRWPAALQNYQSASDLAGFFKGLFFVDRGLYRVIVFVLQDLPFVPSPNQVSGQDARAWLRTGANTLPRDVANRPYGDANCSVLIYEFASDGTAVRMVESRLTGKQHLEKAGVLAILEKSN